MSSDQFEKLIRDNLDEFDRIEKVDTDASWQKFKSKQGAVKVRRIPRWLVYTAAACMIGLGGVFLGYNLLPEPEANFASIIEQDPVLFEIYNDMQTQINVQEKKIQAANVDKESYKELFDELNNLELLQSEFQKDIPGYGTERELIKVLLKNYERKARLLEILLKEIDKNSKYENLETNKSI